MRSDNSRLEAGIVSVHHTTTSKSVTLVDVSLAATMPRAHVLIWFISRTGVLIGNLDDHLRNQTYLAGC